MVLRPIVSLETELRHREGAKDVSAGETSESRGRRMPLGADLGGTQGPAWGGDSAARLIRGIKDLETLSREPGATAATVSKIYCF